MKLNEAMAHIWANLGSEITNTKDPEWKGGYLTVNPETLRLEYETGEPADANDGFENEGWEIIKEPIKYEVTIYLAEHPKADPNNMNQAWFLFGSGNWDSKKTGSCPNKFKITVEEDNS